MTNLSIDVLDQKGKAVEKITLNKDVFGADVNTYLIHSVAVAQANNARQGSKSTLDRTEVRGHAKKPYRQKGTGNARQGSTKGPQFDGGGMAFAIKPRDFSTKINKKQKAAAFVSAISGKLADNEIIVIKSLGIKEGKTKEVASIVKHLAKSKVIAKDTSKILFVKFNPNDTTFVNACANIQSVDVTTANQLSVLDIVNCKYLVASVEAIREIEKSYGGAK